MRPTTLFALIVALGIACFVEPSLAMAQNDADIEAFHNQKMQAENEFNQEKAQLEQEKQQLDSEISDLKARRNQLEKSISRAQTLRFAIFKLPKLLNAGSLLGFFMILARVSYYMLIITLIAIYIFSTARPGIFYNYLSFKAISTLKSKNPINRDPPQPKSPKTIVFTVVILLIILLLCPGAFAEESLGLKAMEADEVISLPEIQKTIKRLERKVLPYIEIGVSVSNPYLKPWPKVKVQSPEYYFSLAALQYEVKEKKYEQNLGFVLSNFDYSRMRDERYEDMLVDILRFFLSQGEEDKIDQTTEKIVPYLDMERLYRVFNYLIQDSYFEIAKIPMNRILYKERDMTRLLSLAEKLMAQGKRDWAENILEIVVEKSSSDEMERLLSFVDGLMKKGENVWAERTLKALIAKFSRNGGRSLDLARYAHSHGLPNLRDDALSNAFKSASYLEVLEASVALQAYDVAIESLENYDSSKRDRVTIQVPEFVTPKILLLPNENISLSAYLALLYLHTGDKGMAVSTLHDAVRYGMDRVINTVDVDRDMLLQSLLCLRYINSTDGYDFGSPELRRLYGNLKNDYIARANEAEQRVKSEREALLNRLRDHIDRGPSRKADIKGEIMALHSKRFFESAKTSSAIIKILTRFVMHVLFLFVAFIFGWEATLSVPRNKTTVFFARAFEIYGIEVLFTITGIPGGLLLIVVSQLLHAHIRACMNTDRIPEIESTT